MPVAEKPRTPARIHADPRRSEQRGAINSHGQWRVSRFTRGWLYRAAGKRDVRFRAAVDEGEAVAALS